MFSTALPCKFFLGELQPAWSDQVKEDGILQLDQSSKLCEGYVMSKAEGNGTVKPGDEKPCGEKSCLQIQEGLPLEEGVTLLSVA